MARELKVLHVVTSLEPGGMENGVVNMAVALEPRSIRMRMACLERAGAFCARLPSSASVEILGKGGGFSPKATARLAAEIFRFRPDVIHAHNLGPLIYSGAATAFGLSCPIIHGEHSQLTPEEKHPRRLRQRRLLYRACRAVHTVSNGISDEILALELTKQKPTVIANGVDTVRFAPGARGAARESLGLPIDSDYLGIVGRFGPFKRHDVLLAAFERIARQLPRLRLLMVGGGGSEEARIAEMARQSPLSDRIHLLGFRAEPAVCYQALDLLALPSTNEGLSNAALEAMACGIPALANVDCGHEQIITSGHDGFIAPLNDSDQLAAQLSAALARREVLERLGENARQTIEKRFSMTAMADGYEELYRRAARRRTR